MTEPLILIIDDDADIAKTLRANLELDGYRVEEAHTGHDGVEAVRGEVPALLLLDLNLPDIDGISVCKVLKRDFSFPIIMLTARDSVSDTVLGLECGADDYVSKPFNYLELSARIKARMRLGVVSDASASSVETGGDIVMDGRARKVTIAGREIKLTKTEYELLKLLVEHDGEVVPRDVIQDHVWGDSQLYHNSRALDVHIQRLRKKVEEDSENPSRIITVSGVGYRLKI